MKKSGSIKNNISSISLILIILILWQLLSSFKIVPEFLLPSPYSVIMSFFTDFNLLMYHLWITLAESMLGLFWGVLLGFICAVLMDKFDFFYRAFYPILILTQTIPTIAIAPLLVLWMGYEMLPKIVLIVIVTFFPISIGLYDGFKSADKDQINLLKAMGATNFDIFKYIKWPGSLNHFFSALKISVSYSVVGAVISEWLGGFRGLGVYMIRVKKSYSFDKMFAVIFLISALSLVLMFLVKLLQKKVMPWKNKGVEL